MTRCWMLLLALSSCGWIAGLKDPLPNDGAGGEFCYGTGMLVVCFSAQPSGTQSIANSIDTGGFGCSANVVSGGDGVCVISGGTIDVPAGAMVNATNPTSGAATPLVLVADDAITIEGTLELGGGHSGATAAGAPFSGCQAGTNPNGSNPSGGGQGGSCAARGGDGGDGAGSASGGTSGAALAVPTMLHGGCPGARGGGEGGQGGHGGGAVYLIANHTITISGRLDASGGGGGGADGDNGTGGGGGGAGGMIVLDAPTIAVDGAVCAIGGSGAAGSTNGQSPSGGDATGGTTACAPGTPGHASSGAGDGGLGGIDGVGAVGVTGSSGGGGGGGGGSTGWVKLYGTKTGSGALKPAGT